MGSSENTLHGLLFVVVINKFHHISAVVWKCKDPPPHFHVCIFPNLYQNLWMDGWKNPLLFAEEGAW